MYTWKSHKFVLLYLWQLIVIKILVTFKILFHLASKIRHYSSFKLCSFYLWPLSPPSYSVFNFSLILYFFPCYNGVRSHCKCSIFSVWFFYSGDIRYTSSIDWKYGYSRISASSTYWVGNSTNISVSFLISTTVIQITEGH
jgi:hypothetical protein